MLNGYRNFDDLLNLYPGGVSHENPIFFIVSRAPAHVVACETKQEVFDFLKSRLELPIEEALEFEITDLKRC